MQKEIYTSDLYLLGNILMWNGLLSWLRLIRNVGKVVWNFQSFSLQTLLWTTVCRLDVLFSFLLRLETEHFVFLGIFGFHVLLNFTYFLCSLNVKCVRLGDDHLIWQTYRGEEKFCRKGNIKSKIINHTVKIVLNKMKHSKSSHCSWRTAS